MYWYGDIHIANIIMGRNITGAVQPVVIISDDISNKISQEVTAVPIIADPTTVMCQNYVVVGDYGLQGKNIIAVERVILINKKWVFEKIGSIRGTVYLERIMHMRKLYEGYDKRRS